VNVAIFLSSDYIKCGGVGLFFSLIEEIPRSGLVLDELIIEDLRRITTVVVIKESQIPPDICPSNIWDKSTIESDELSITLGSNLTNHGCNFLKVLFCDLYSLDCERLSNILLEFNNCSFVSC
jgi:hypothetical protein